MPFIVCHDHVKPYHVACILMDGPVAAAQAGITGPGAAGHAPKIAPPVGLNLWWGSFCQRCYSIYIHHDTCAARSRWMQGWACLRPNHTILTGSDIQSCRLTFRVADSETHRHRTMRIDIVAMICQKDRQG
eukprot:4479617-Amphidinium_carterae.1